MSRGCIADESRAQPVPLDLLTLASFSDLPTQRGTGILRGLRGGERGTPGEVPGPMPTAMTPDTPGDSRLVYPCTIFYNGRLGGPWTLFADSAQARGEWKEKLEEAIGLRKVVQESNRVFEVETLSTDTFLVPSALAQPANSSWNSENSFTGKVTCSVPFSAYPPSASCACALMADDVVFFSDHGWSGAGRGRVRGGRLDRVPARRAMCVVLMACRRLR